MNLGQYFLRFLGRSWIAPLKLMGESTVFTKKAIGGFCGPKGSCVGGGTVGVCGGPLGG